MTFYIFHPNHQEFWEIIGEKIFFPDREYWVVCSAFSPVPKLDFVDKCDCNLLIPERLAVAQHNRKVLRNMERIKSDSLGTFTLDSGDQPSLLIED